MIDTYARDQLGLQMKLPPPPLLSSPLQSQKFVVDSRMRFIKEPGYKYRPAGRIRKQNPTLRGAISIGPREPFVGRHDEALLVMNQHSSAIHINKNSSPADIATLTNHHQISLEPPLLKSDSKSKISKCRWFCDEGHLIIHSATIFIQMERE